MVLGSESGTQQQRAAWQNKKEVLLSPLTSPCSPYVAICVLFSLFLFAPKKIILLATFLFLSYSALYSLAGIDACFVSELAKFRTSKVALRAALSKPKHLARWVDYLETKRSEVAFTIFGGLNLDIETVTKFVTF